MDSDSTCREIKENYQNILERATIAAINCNRSIEDIKIISVSKTHPAKILECAYNCGLKIFGENYVQEMTDKYQILHDKGYNDLIWHFIGHLQTNKVKYISPFIDVVHSVDSLKLASEIDKRAEQNQRKTDIMLQVNTSGELNKSGCDPDYLIDFAGEVVQLKNIRVLGLMTIGTFTDDEKLQRNEFSLLRNLLEETNKQLKLNLIELSMGMTGDFEVAIDEGSTILRIGTAIFGNRSYRI